MKGRRRRLLAGRCLKVGCEEAPPRRGCGSILQVIEGGGQALFTSSTWVLGCGSRQSREQGTSEELQAGKREESRGGGAGNVRVEGGGREAMGPEFGWR